MHKYMNNESLKHAHGDVCLWTILLHHLDEHFGVKIQRQFELGSELFHSVTEKGIIWNTFVVQRQKL